jgi:hypothetical protein
MGFSSMVSPHKLYQNLYTPRNALTEAGSWPAHFPSLNTTWDGSSLALAAIAIGMVQVKWAKQQGVKNGAELHDSHDDGHGHELR